jgi:hypothetical protein
MVIVTSRVRPDTITSIVETKYLYVRVFYLYRTLAYVKLPPCEDDYPTLTIKSSFSVN